MRFAAKAGIILATVMATAGVSVPAAAGPSTEPRMVTLITGDRLRVSPDGTTVTRLPSPGRDGVPLLTRYAGGHLEVVPADAAGLLADDRLDHHLFDVTELLADGYTDAVPVIITYQGSNPASVVGPAAGGVPVRDLDTIEAIAVRVAGSTTATLWRLLSEGSLRTGYRKVWLDRLAQPSTDVSVPLVGAPAAWAGGFTGSGVPVGVLDTGVDASHPDVAQGVAQTADFTGGDDEDRAGHGTAVASIIAGSGAASAGRYRGMAPDAQIWSAKVCRPGGCPDSAVLAAMQWAARDHGLRVVNLSLGQPDEPGTDLLEQAVGTLSARYGTLFVVAAGNDGPVSSPASADAALAVGASTLDDTAAGFSARGPRTGDGGLKPDLAAPGVGIAAARSDASSEAALAGDPRYTTLTGTSAAAPHVAGAAALLAQTHPAWTAADLKAGLMNAATPLSGADPDQAGAGRLDIAKAVTATVLAEPATVSFGRRQAVATQVLTYRNLSAVPVTLDLAVASNAPAGTFALDADSVTLAGNSSVGVLVRATPGVDRATGVVTATGGGVSVRTPVAIERPPRTYRLAVRYTSRAGTPATETYGGAYAVDGSTWARLPNAGGTGELRLPAGAYTIDANLIGDGVTVLDQPRLVLDRDTTLDLDARLARPIAIPPPEPGAAEYAASLRVTAGDTRAGLLADSFDGVTSAQIGAAAAPGFRTDLTSAWAQPGPDSPYRYSLAWTWRGRFLTGFAPAPGTTAPFLIRFTPGRDGIRSFTVRHREGSAAGPVTRFGLHVSYDGGATWRPALYSRIGDGGIVLLRPPPGAGVLLRAWAADDAGNRSEQTFPG